MHKESGKKIIHEIGESHHTSLRSIEDGHHHKQKHVYHK